MMHTYMYNVQGKLAKNNNSNMQSCGKALNILPKALDMDEDTQTCCALFEVEACLFTCNQYFLLLLKSNPSVEEETGYV